MTYFNFIKDIGNLEERKVLQETVNGLLISTVYSSDYGFETAICDPQPRPVERYGDNIEKAYMGHEKWIGKIRNKVTHITELKSFGLPPAKHKLKYPPTLGNSATQSAKPRN